MPQHRTREAPRRCVSGAKAEANHWMDLFLVSRRGLIVIVFDAPEFPESRIPGELRGTRRSMCHRLREKSGHRTRIARMKTFEKGLSNKGYAKHTPTLRKPKFRLTDAHRSVKIAE